MKPIKRFKALIMGVPFRYKNVWYNQSIHTRELYPEVVDKRGIYIPCKKGARVVMGHTKNDEPIYYRVTSCWVRDNAASEYPSDAWMCNLEFEGVETINTK